MNSISVTILWSLAEREALSGGFETILPMHFWIALGKAVDLDVTAFLKNADDEVKRLEPFIERELETVRRVLSEAGIPAQKFRRSLRSSLGRGEHSNGQLPIHRGQSVRTAFRRAGRLVQDSESYLLPIHLCSGLMSLSDPAFDTVLETCGSSGSRLQGAINQQLARLVAVDRGEGVAPPPIPEANAPANKPGKPKSVLCCNLGVTFLIWLRRVNCRP